MFQNALAIHMHDGNAVLAARATRACGGAGFLLRKYYDRRPSDNHIFLFLSYKWLMTNPILLPNGWAGSQSFINGV